MRVEFFVIQDDTKDTTLRFVPKNTLPALGVEESERGRMLHAVSEGNKLSKVLQETLRPRTLETLAKNLAGAASVRDDPTPQGLPQDTLEVYQEKVAREVATLFEDEELRHSIMEKIRSVNLQEVADLPATQKIREKAIYETLKAVAQLFRCETFKQRIMSLRNTIPRQP